MWERALGPHCKQGKSDFVQEADWRNGQDGKGNTCVSMSSVALINDPATATCRALGEGGFGPQMPFLA